MTVFHDDVSDDTSGYSLMLKQVPFAASQRTFSCGDPRFYVAPSEAGSFGGMCYGARGSAPRQPGEQRGRAQ